MRERAGNDRCVACSSQECRVRRDRVGPGTSGAAAAEDIGAGGRGGGGSGGGGGGGSPIVRRCAAARRRRPDLKCIRVSPPRRRCRALRHLSAAGPNRSGSRRLCHRVVVMSDTTTVVFFKKDFRDFVCSAIETNRKRCIITCMGHVSSYNIDLISDELKIVVAQYYNGTKVGANEPYPSYLEHYLRLCQGSADDPRKTGRQLSSARR